MNSSERKKTIYKNITGWKRDTELLSIPGSNRQIVKLILGDVSYRGNIIEYITEEIYKDLLDNILDNPKEYVVTIQVENVPQLTITCEGALISHNHIVPTYINEIIEIIKQLPGETILDAYLEMRLNMNGLSKLKGSSIILMALIEKKSSKKYSIPFVRSVICQYIEEFCYPTDGNMIKNILRSLDYKSLVEYANEVIRYKTTGEVKDEYLKEIINNSAKEESSIMKEIEILIGEETLLRLYKGTLQLK